MQTDTPTDDEFELSLLELLNNAKFQIHAIHGELLDAWYAEKEAGPLLIMAFSRLIEDNYAEELDRLYPDTSIFTLHLDATGPETASYLIVMTHKNFGALAMFGQELTPEQFAEQVALANASGN